LAYVAGISGSENGAIDTAANRAQA
jgi:hypothetical protein